MRARQRWRSLRLRLMLGTAVLAVLFMLVLLQVLQGVFSLALDESIEKRLAADAAALVSAARIENGRLVMPDKLPDEEFDNLDSRLLGFIYDRDGQLVCARVRPRTRRCPTCRATTAAATSCCACVTPRARSSSSTTWRSTCCAVPAPPSASSPCNPRATTR